MRAVIDWGAVGAGAGIAAVVLVPASWWWTWRHDLKKRRAEHEETEASEAKVERAAVDGLIRTLESRRILWATPELEVEHEITKSLLKIREMLDAMNGRLTRQRGNEAIREMVGACLRMLDLPRREGERSGDDRLTYMESLPEFRSKMQRGISMLVEEYALDPYIPYSPTWGGFLEEGTPFWAPPPMPAPPRLPPDPG